MGPLSKIKLMSFVNIDLSFSGFPVFLEILITSCSSKIDLGRPGMTFSHYLLKRIIRQLVSQKSKVKRELIKAQIILNYTSYTMHGF